MADRPERYVVVLGAGSLREDSGQLVPHDWTPDGVSVRCEAAGTHVLHMTVAGRVLDDVYRAAAARGARLHGVQVRAEGALDHSDVEQLGVQWSVAIDSPLLPEDVDALVGAIDPVGEVPEALHAGVEVRRVGHV